jgi:hypothetical protein
MALKKADRKDEYNTGLDKKRKKQASHYPIDGVHSIGSASEQEKDS